MRSLDLLVAWEKNSVQNLISDLKNKPIIYRFFCPSTLDDLLKESFSTAFLAIIDFNFCGNRGFEALMRLKASKPSLPIIFTTAQGSEDICLSAFRLGARDYFSKPFEIEDIARRIELFSKIKKEDGQRINILSKHYTENFPDVSSQIPVIKNMHPGIEKTKRFIDNNYKDSINLSDLSRIACMSRYHFCRSFKSQTGITFKKYLKTVRYRAAKNLLEDPRLSITEICFLVGYKDLTYFEKAFKDIEGICPSIYRKISFLQK